MTSHRGPLSLKSFELVRVGGGTRLAGEFMLEKVQHLGGVGNRPLSALLTCLHKSIEGSLVICEYSEHAHSHGTEVGTVSYPHGGRATILSHLGALFVLLRIVGRISCYSSLAPTSMHV